MHTKLRTMFDCRIHNERAMVAQAVALPVPSAIPARGRVNLLNTEKLIVCRNMKRGMREVMPLSCESKAVSREGVSRHEQSWLETESDEQHSPWATMPPRPAIMPPLRCCAGGGAAAAQQKHMISTLRQ